MMKINNSSLSYYSFYSRKLASAGWRAFTVAAPSAWNSLADNLCDQALGLKSFRRLLKDILVCAPLTTCTYESH